MNIKQNLKKAIISIKKTKKEINSTEKEIEKIEKQKNELLIEKAKHESDVFLSVFNFKSRSNE